MAAWVEARVKQAVYVRKRSPVKHESDRALLITLIFALIRQNLRFYVTSLPRRS